MAGRAGAAKMAYQTFRQEYLQVPPVTRAYTTACVLTTAAVVSARPPLAGPDGHWERGGGRGAAVEGEPSDTAPAQSRVWSREHPPERGDPRNRPRGGAKHE